MIDRLPAVELGFWADRLKYCIISLVDTKRSAEIRAHPALQRLRPQGPARHRAAFCVRVWQDGEKNKAPYAFVTFRFAADADCSVVDTQHFPGVQRQLAMGFATPRKKAAGARGEG